MFPFLAKVVVAGAVGWGVGKALQNREQILAKGTELADKMLTFLGDRIEVAADDKTEEPAPPDPWARATYEDSGGVR